MNAPRTLAAAPLALAVLASASQSHGATPARTVIVCPISAQESLKIEVPSKLGDLPAIDFDTPSKATLFSFRDGNLLAVAVDAEDPGRTRVVISAQLNRSTGAYNGQYVVDFGGNQLQLDNGPVICKAGH